ncbi:MAG: hypothetical protein KKC20_02595 [Proteobacteria bacterium]|nr:hypothetical protein [Pseudomonadota bacterium]
MGKTIVVTGATSGIGKETCRMLCRMAFDGMVLALRMEGKPFGIEAATINPGDVKSDFTINRGLANACVQGSPYYEHSMKSSREMIRSEQVGRSPEEIAQKILQMVRARTLNPKYFGETKYKLVMILKSFMSDRIVETLLMKVYQ